jgi:branched-chain amino acid transport system substrate-binding protein
MQTFENLELARPSLARFPPLVQRSAEENESSSARVCRSRARRSMKPPLLAALAAASLQAAVSFGAPADAVSDGVVRIGLLLDLSGRLAYFAGEGNAVAARMAVEDFGGQVLGRPIEVVTADHRNLPHVAAEQAREWFDTGKVDALMDVTSTAAALAVARIAREKHRIAIFNSPASARLTNEACTPVTVHWAYDSYAIAHVTGAEIVRDGGDTWYFVTADYNYGHALEKDATQVVRAAGGKVLGSTLHAIGSADFASHMLRARQSGAKVVALATAGPDFQAAMKAATALGIGADGKQRLAVLAGTLNDVHNLGLAVTQGLYLASAFYSDLGEESRAWSQRFFERRQEMPNMIQAGVYSATMHYLKAVQAAGTDDTDEVMKKMREMPVNFFGHRGRLREDGRMVHDMYLFEVKRPEDSAEAWDYLKLRATVPAEQAFRPLEQSACRLVKR